MYPPQKKGSPSSRAAVLNAGSSIGLSLDQTLAHFRQQRYEAQQAREAQQRRYQQITRSMRPYVQQRLVTPRDKAIAYHAQAASRAYLRYQAITNGQARLAKVARQQVVANQTYIRQGQTHAESEMGKRQAISNKIAQNTREMMQNQPETTGIASGVVVGMVVSSQVVGPELLVGRIVTTARFLGGVRASLAFEWVAQGLSYQVGSSSGILTRQSVLRAVGTFAGRTTGDVGIQFGGGLLAHGWNVGEAYDEINLTSAGMAGLPGDGMWHSLRNNIVGAGLEFKLNRKHNFLFLPISFTQNGLLNFGQKVAIGVGTDYLSSGLSGRLQQKGLLLKNNINRTRNPFVKAYNLYQLMYMKPLEAVSTNTISIIGEASSNAVEDRINSEE